jgi:hypothetical protein
LAAAERQHHLFLSRQLFATQHPDLCLLREAEVTDEGLGFGNPKALFAYACCAQKLRCMCGILDLQWC